MESNLTKEDLEGFFEERPSLSRDGIAREAGISPKTLQYAHEGKRSVTTRTKELLMPVLLKYGYFYEKYVSMI
jgi:hypothetical protein